MVQHGRVLIVLVATYASVASSFSTTHSSITFDRVARTRRSAENRDGGVSEIPDTTEECSILDAEVGAELKKLGDLEPLERQLIRLDGFEPYILVSILTADASYETYTNLEVASNPGAALDVPGDLLFLSCFGSILCGLYSTIVFSLTVLYGKTALGLDREATYVYFLEQTTAKRERGYQAFILSLALFGTNILILAVNTLPDKFTTLGSVVAFGIFIFSVTEFLEITNAAKPIFTNLIPQSTDPNGALKPPREYDGDDPNQSSYD